MRFVYLYGPPGVGKLTVGTELAALTGFKLFHNHLTVNLATAIFERGSRPWRDMIRFVRNHVVTEAVKEDVSLIYTGVYDGTNDQLQWIGTMLQPIYDSGGTVVFVQLRCEWDEHARRIGGESRVHHQKLTDPEAVRARFNPAILLPLEPQVGLDTTHLTAAEAAAQIAQHHDLPLIQPAGPCRPKA
jgi:hypothetical protein